MILTWTTSEAETLVLANAIGDDYFLNSYQGMDSPDSNVLNQQAPYQYGVSYLRSQLASRQITLEIMIRSNNLSQLEVRRRYLSRIFSSLASDGSLNAGTLSIAGADGSNYQIGCTPRDCRHPTSGQKGLLIQISTITLLAGDPFFYATQQLTVPMTYNVSTEVINNGDILTEPILRITGPCNSPKVESSTTGRYIETTTNIASGYRLDIDCRFGKKTITQVKLSDQSTLNKFADLKDGSSWPTLLKGSNYLKLTSQDAQGSCSCLYTQRYLSVA